MAAPYSKEMTHLLELAFGLAIGKSFTSEPVVSTLEQKLAYYSRMQGEQFEQTGQGIACLRGLHQVQQLAYQSGGSIRGIVAQASELPKVASPPWELVAALETLATANLVVAGHLMPKPLIEAAEAWQAASADEQVVLCEKVYDALLSAVDPSEKAAAAESNPEDYWLEDYNNQPAERIFPLQFLREKKTEPNCFGKGQMLTAFAQRVGARHYGATPILTTEDFVHPRLLTIISMIAEWSNARGIALPSKLQAVFNRRVDAEKAIKSAPSRFHMALVIELKDGRWYFIDPHMRSRGLLSNNLEMAVAPELVDYLCPVLPGFTVLMTETGQAQEKLEKGCLDAGAIIEKSHRMLDDWQSVAKNPGAVLPILSREGVLEVLVEEQVGIADEQLEMFQQAMRGEKFFFAQLKKEDGQSAPVVFRDRTGIEIPIVQQMRLQIALQIVVTLSGGAVLKKEGGFDSEALTEAMMRILGIMQSLAYRRICRGLAASREKPSMVHPVFELYEPSFRIGVELISHLNCLNGESNEVIMELANGQLKLHHPNS